MTDEADSSVVLAELQVALFRECNNQRLSPWARLFSCSPDPGAPVAQWVKRWPPDLADRVRSSLEVKSSQP